jgi:ribosomal protein L9
MELYRLLKDKLGEQETKALIEAFEEVTEQAKKEVATKADISALKSELKSDILLVETRLEAKIRLYFIILALLFLITNPKAMDLLSKLIGLAK